MKTKEGASFVDIGSKIMKQAQLSFGSIVTLIFEWDTSNYQFEFPAKFAEVLKQDEEANAIFQAVLLQ